MRTADYHASAQNASPLAGRSPFLGLTTRPQPDDVDEDVHPTGAWLLGERIDPDVLDRLHGIVRGED